jgi:integrase
LIPRPRTLVENTRYLTDPKYLGPLLGMPVDTISLKDVAARIVTVAHEFGDATAVKARSALNSFFAWAMRMGLAAANPCIGSENPKTEARDRVLTGAELAAIWNVCGDDDYGRVIRLLILTGCRRAEIGDMRWNEFSDLEGPQPTWTLPKARAKNSKAHCLPLMPMTAAIIRSVPRMASRDQLFGTRAAYGFSGWGRAKAGLDQRCAVKDHWTVHDIRRSVATGMADIGVQPHVIEAILNHVSGHKAGVAGIYNRSAYTREVRAALAMWEDHVRVLIDGTDRKIIAILSQAAS